MNPSLKTWVIRCAAAIGALLLLVGFVLMVKGFMKKSDGPKHKIEMITLLKPPPPPPPPKPEEKPPEPPKVKDEVKIDTPKDDQPKPAEKADEPPPAGPLGVDAAGGAGSDGFGLAARSGGRDITSGLGGRGAYYTGLIQRQFYEALQRNRKFPKEDFRVVVSIWLGEDGRVVRAEVLNGSGKSELDDVIKTTLIEMPPLKDVPPVALRQVQMRLSNRS